MSHITASMIQLRPLPVRAEGNSLLALLSPGAYDALVPHCETVSLTAREVLYKPVQSIGYVHFPTAGVLSVVKDLTGGGAVEVMTVGREGMSGMPIMLGGDSTPSRCFVQIAGSAKRIPSQVFRALDPVRSEIHGVLGRYTQGALNQIAQGVVCNQMHSVEQRCARWLLATRDRAGVDEFALTHEFLSFMLGVRRASVSDVEAVLRARGLIQSSRGRVRIIDRGGLEATSCECYRCVRNEFERRLGPGAEAGLQA
jgi:CRP-like cAMP-binding protein